MTDIEEQSARVVEHVHEVAGAETIKPVEPPTVALHEPFYVDLGGGNLSLVMMTNFTITRDGGGTTVVIEAVDSERYIREHTAF